MTKLKLGVIASVAFIGLSVPLLIQHRAQLRLQDQMESLRAQAVQLRSENDSLSRQAVKAKAVQELSSKEVSELLRLRGEVGRLRGEVKSLEQARALDKNRAKQLALEGNQSPNSPVRGSSAFQVRLVSNDQDENAETITNRAGLNPTNGSPETLYVQKASLIDSSAIQSATLVTDPQTGNPQINVVLTDQGRDLFAQATKENLNRQLAIVMDGQSYLAPRVRSEITDGRLQVSGSFTREQAEELIAKINSAIRQQ